MSPPRLTDLARLTGAPLEEIALAIAAEFKRVDAPRARARLDLLAGGLRVEPGADPERRAAELIDGLGRRAGFTVSPDRGPGTLMLDEVIERRRGDPLALAIVYAAVASRAGFELFAIGDERSVLLGDPASDPPLAIDPIPGGRALPPTMRWLCPHLVALRLLEEIGGRYLNRGHLGPAIRAAELRLELPLAARLRERHERDLISLRAILN